MKNICLFKLLKNYKKLNFSFKTFCSDNIENLNRCQLEFNRFFFK